MGNQTLKGLREALEEAKKLILADDSYKTEPDTETYEVRNSKERLIKLQVETALGEYGESAGSTAFDIKSKAVQTLMSSPLWRRMETDEAQEKLKQLEGKRPEIIVWLAYFQAVNRFDDTFGRETTGWGVNNQLVRINTDFAKPTFTRINIENGEEEQAYKIINVLDVLIDRVITKEDYANAIKIYEEYFSHIRKYANEEVKSSIGAWNIMKKLRGENHEASYAGIRSELEYIEMPANWLTSRTWGFEVEVPDAKGVDVASGSGIEKGEDGSLRSYESSNDCECDCDDCTYHDCDCDHCDSQNTDPDHCGASYCASCDSAEFRSQGGISRGIHPGLVKLSEDLIAADAENNDTAGVHIHVFARDLNMSQVCQVVATYALLANVLSKLAGREGTGYAQTMTSEMLGNVMRKKNPSLYGDKAYAVNVMHLKNENRGTIEFRQMACNFDWREITIWAAIVRGIVTCAKRGAKFYDYKNINTIAGIFEVFKKFQYELGNEQVDGFVYGSKVDKAHIALELKNEYVYNS
jgi:hypothetical protein